MIEIAERLAAEIHPRRAAHTHYSLDSSLDRDLGLDSLGRVELVARIEAQLAVAVPEDVVVSAETLRDLLLAFSTPAHAEIHSVRHAPVPEAGPGHPQAAKTLLDVLAWHAARHPDRNHITLLKPDGADETVSYGELLHETRAAAGALQQRGLKPGDKVMIMLPTSRDYFVSFLAVLWAGAVAVPIYPPARVSQLQDHVRRHRSIAESSGARMLITVSEARGIARLLKIQTDTLRTVLTVDQLREEGHACPPFPARGDDVCFLQYTSGSTGNPKGVVLTHANLLANVRAAGQALQAGTGDVFVSWLPLYHDMGLIGAWFGTLFHATRLVIMPPLSFLTRPQRWLWALHEYRGTLSAAPNFAYELCLKHVRDSDIEGLDLSSWRWAMNGAEPVHPETLRRFGERYACYGLRREALAPVYGLAECSVALTIPPPQRGPLIDRVDRRSFSERGLAIAAGAQDEAVLEFVACGQPIPGHEVRIVNELGSELPERREGRLQFRGPSATSGYHGNPEATASLLKGEWLEPGDLAYIAEGDVYITGRVKDVIIRAGRNIYPHEIESLVGNVAGVRRGRVAVFGSPDPDSGTERLIVFAETTRRDEATLEAIRAEINETVTDLIGGAPEDIAFAPPGTVLRTSSGKIRRSACREIYEQGLIGQRQPLRWRQVLNLFAGALQPTLKRWRRDLLSYAYGAYACLVFALLMPPIWTLVVLLPRETWRWAVLRSAAPVLFGSLAMPCRVTGTDRLPAQGQAAVYAANHASYLDSFFLVGFFPRMVSYVAKIELTQSRTMRLFLERIGTEFVERYDLQKGLADARRIADRLAGGRSVLFYPEGTFTRVPGLLPFQMGAFIAASENEVPVVPIALQGTRNLLRAYRYLPLPGEVTIKVGTPIDTRAIKQDHGGDVWRTAVALRNAARAFIVAECREPDLAHEPTPRWD